jgi:hypothetical protein
MYPLGISSVFICYFTAMPQLAHCTYLFSQLLWTALDWTELTHSLTWWLSTHPALTQEHWNENWLTLIHWLTHYSSVLYCTELNWIELQACKNFWHEDFWYIQWGPQFSSLAEQFLEQSRHYERCTQAVDVIPLMLSSHGSIKFNSFFFCACILWLYKYLITFWCSIHHHFIGIPLLFYGFLNVRIFPI